MAKRDESTNQNTTPPIWMRIGALVSFALLVVAMFARSQILAVVTILLLVAMVAIIMIWRLLMLPRRARTFRREYRRSLGIEDED